jgi:hypothetical protein
VTLADTMQKSRELDELLARPWGNEMADESNLKLSGEVSGILGGSLKGVLADVRKAVDEVRLEIAGAASELVEEVKTGKQIARALRTEAANVRTEYATILGNAPPAEGEKG